MTLKRFGVSLEENILKILDDFVKEHKFPNRSQAVRFLIRNNLVKEAWEKDRTVVGAVVLIYDYHKHDMLKKSLNIQHNFSKFILGAQHIHLDREHCLEIIALRGKASILKNLADRLISLKGVKHGKLITSGF